jgi:hypothetical protein
MPLAVPNPSTLAPGNLVTGALWNAQVRDALNFLLNPPIFAAYQTTATAAWTGWTTLALQSVVVDSYTGYNGSSPTRYTAQVAGWYQANGVVCWSSNSSGFRNCAVGVNGTRTIGSGQDLPADADFTNVASNLVNVFLNVGDYVELWGYTSVSVGTNIGISDLRTRLDVRWVHQ